MTNDENQKNDEARMTNDLYAASNGDSDAWEEAFWGVQCAVRTNGASRSCRNNNEGMTGRNDE